MGFFDRVTVGSKTFQTKAFGEGMSHFTLGDEAPLGKQATVLAKRFGVKSFQVEALLQSTQVTEEATIEGAGSNEWAVGTAIEDTEFKDWYLLVRDGLIQGVSEKRDSTLPLLDYRGNLAD